jgi:hypothetical protein
VVAWEPGQKGEERVAAKGLEGTEPQLAWCFHLKSWEQRGCGSAVEHMSSDEPGLD